MDINIKFLHIPPYISSSWNNISALSFDETKGVLKIVLTSGTLVEIPRLPKETLEKIFQTHAKALSAEESPSSSKEGLLGFKIPLGMGDQLLNFGSMMQHNFDQRHSPPLSKDLLNKIRSTIHAIGMDPSLFPDPEPHCNCPHCQIAKAILPTSEESAPLEGEEEISEEDLRFQDWEIEQTNDHLYLVTNPLNKKEHYNVFLGKPLGCTCGEKNCEHLRAVLRT
ncbi:MAG: hypothetical protein A2Y28_02325 [Chlamydiae bacterium GWC2_50_10]|nr:MAG: hypothetical protein A2Y28_02325 [Chlamydiae bacterium GWC2_50_10]OGN58964.1 MAG: hypothetical protein A3D18_02535 [Chlamydiae bacterium RIFCSPHIGHO2_02_FULL_49_29]OGN64467.1 MAG: hypothetical protein A3E26_03725 [Chlamydiae bacterium RIFCSPHIGHO2_12_FULL_49_32]OGN70108.1 MAG: hypothetical protein A3I15_01295 [Chlamydiae bacterium RIFCSPLOWO2_02_FULL_49_12]HCJ84714.1 hypothetical protein [Parachlamydiales bacterium]